MAQLATPSNGNFADGIAFLLNAEKVNETAKIATKWVINAIELLKSCKDNPYGDDDETIAKAILDKMNNNKND